MDNELRFIYCTARGEVTERRVSNAKSNENYVTGYCHLRKSPKTFSIHRITDKNQNFSGTLLEEAIRNLPPIEQKSNNPNGAAICFTGYKKNDKNTLKELADEKGFYVTSGVIQHLDFLSCGPTAGPSKIKKAKELEVTILNEVQTRLLFETGEVPRD